jgi:hypothetical protein
MTAGISVLLVFYPLIDVIDGGTYLDHEDSDRHA